MNKITSVSKNKKKQPKLPLKFNKKDLLINMLCNLGQHDSLHHKILYTKSRREGKSN